MIDDKRVVESRLKYQTAIKALKESLAREVDESFLEELTAANKVAEMRRALVHGFVRGASALAAGALVGGIIGFRLGRNK